MTNDVTISTCLVLLSIGNLPIVTFFRPTISILVKCPLQNIHLYPIVVSIRRVPAEVQVGYDAAGELHHHADCVHVIHGCYLLIVAVSLSIQRRGELPENPARLVNVMYSKIIEESTCKVYRTFKLGL